MKTFVPSSGSWKTAEEFLNDAFQLVYDVDPLEEILVMKDSSNGYQMKMFVDGDLFCTIIFYDQDGNQVWSISWQGTTRVEGISMEAFQKELHHILEKLESEHSRDADLHEKCLFWEKFQPPF